MSIFKINMELDNTSLFCLDSPKVGLIILKDNTYYSAFFYEVDEDFIKTITKLEKKGKSLKHTEVHKGIGKVTIERYLKNNYGDKYDNEIRTR